MMRIIDILAQVSLLVEIARFAKLGTVLVATALPARRLTSFAPANSSEFKHAIQAFLRDGLEAGYGLISTWNLGAVTDMSETFVGASSFNEPLGNWDTSAVTDMSRMFEDACSFSQPIGDWDTSAVTDMSGMFKDADSFSQPIAKWNVAKVNSMASTFDGASSFDQQIGDWDTSAVTDMSAMFEEAASFSQPIGKWNTAKVKNMASTFDGASSFDQHIGNWDTSNVRNFYKLFDSAHSFNKPLINWNTSAVTDVENMFSHASLFNQPISAWDVLAVTIMDDMFEEAMTFNQPLGSWNTAAVTSMSDTFKEAYAFNQPIATWDTSSVTAMTGMFDRAATFNQPLQDWNIQAVQDMEELFSRAASFNQPIRRWNVSAVTSMERMFYMAESFNQPLMRWDTSAVVNMKEVFFKAQAFNQPIFWKTSAVSDCEDMFANSLLMTDGSSDCVKQYTYSMLSRYHSGSTVLDEIASWDKKRCPACSSSQRCPEPRFACYDGGCWLRHEGYVHLLESVAGNRVDVKKIGFEPCRKSCNGRQNCTAFALQRGTGNCYLYDGRTSSQVDVSFDFFLKARTCDLYTCPSATIWRPNSSNSLGMDTNTCCKCPEANQIFLSSELQCGTCDAGMVPNLEQTKCERCPPGEYAPQGKATCSQCEAGNVPTLGRDKCKPCQSGKRASPGDASCDVCPGGKIPDDARAVCFNCSAGAFSQPASIACEPCAAGTFSLEGSSVCNECLAGHYAAGKLNTACDYCQAGRFNEEVGKSSCRFCPLNTYSPKGSVNPTSCFCLPEYYYISSEKRCARCNDPNIECKGGYVAPVAKEGYYMVAYNRAEQCKVTTGDKQSVCLKGLTFDDRKCISFCSEPSDYSCECDADTLNDGSCMEGHTGLLCGACVQGWTREAAESKCVPCSTKGGAVTLILRLIGEVVLTSLIALFLASRSISSAASVKTIDSVLVRNLQSWLAVMSVLALVDFSTVSMFSWSQKEILASSDGQATHHDMKFASFPTWFQGTLAAMTGILNLASSSQESNECLAEIFGSSFGNEPNELKLVLPVAWWLLFPILLSGVVASSMFCLVQIFFLLRRVMGGKSHISELLTAIGIDKHTAKEIVKTMSRKEQLRILHDQEDFFADEEQLSRTFSRLVSDEREQRNPALDQMICHKLHRYLKVTRIRNASDNDPSLLQSVSKSIEAEKTVEKTLMLKIVQGEVTVKESAANQAAFNQESALAVLHNPAAFLSDGGLEKYFPDVIYVEATGEYKITANRILIADDVAHGIISETIPNDYIIFGMFRSRKPKKVLEDSWPIILIAIYSIWSLVTTKFLLANHAQMIRVENHSHSNSTLVIENVSKVTVSMLPHWKYDPRVTVGSAEHMPILIISIAGLVGWSFLYIGYLAFLICRQKHKMSYQCLHKFGFFYNGLEPKFWYWELAIKKLDVLLMYIVAYTGFISSDQKAKLICYTAISGLFWVAHKTAQPFDNRCNRLCDRMDDLGLQTRFLTFCAIQTLLLIGSVASHTVHIICALAVILNMTYLVKMIAVIVIELLEEYVVEFSRQDELSKLETFVSRIASIILAPKRHLEERVPRIVWCGTAQPVRLALYNLQENTPSMLRRIINMPFENIYYFGNERQSEEISQIIGSMQGYLFTTLGPLPQHAVDFLIVFTIAVRTLLRKQADVGYAEVAHECRMIFERASLMSLKDFGIDLVKLQESPQNGPGNPIPLTSLYQNRFDVEPVPYSNLSQFQFNTCAAELSEAEAILHRYGKRQLLVLLEGSVPHKQVDLQPHNVELSGKESTSRPQPQSQPQPQPQPESNPQPNGVNLIIM